MDSLPAFLARLIRSDRHGGRTLRIDEATLVLYDCCVWSDAHSQAVKDRHPECEIVIQPCQSSLSGFMVVFRMHSEAAACLWWGSAMVAFAALVLLTVRQFMAGGDL
jgi:hypothetical protein